MTPAPAKPPLSGTRVRGTRQAEALSGALDGLPGFCRVDTIRDASGETLYRRCASHVHHHHLTCRQCGRSVEVEGRVVERWAEQVAAEAGFTAVDHTVEMFGLCPNCGTS